jgi:hypothetical protein
MHASGWIDLVRTIPSELHASLTFLMQNHAEINSQNVVRLVEQFIVLRGRLAGSTDGGMIFFLPYDQITAISVNKPTKAEAAYAWFPNAPCYSMEAEEPESTVVAEDMEPEVQRIAPAPMPAAPAAAPAMAPAAVKPVPPSKPGVPTPLAPSKPGIATVPARPAPGPQPATTPMAMANLAMPAKAAMIERLRKRQPPAGPAPEQK